jgi:hypothetical protein
MKKSIILIFAIALSNTHAAQMCEKAMTSYACSQTGNVWAVGEGCDNQYDGTADLSARCANILYSGVSLKTNKNCSPASMSTENPGANWSGDYVWCRLSYKKNWHCIGSYPGSTSEAICANTSLAPIWIRMFVNP